MANPQRTETELPAFDRAEALDLLDQDEELLQELATIFLHEGPDSVKELRESLEQGDAERLRRAAHSLKGAAHSLAAHALAVSAFALEQIAREGRLDKAPAALKRVETDVRRVTKLLMALAKD